MVQKQESPQGAPRPPAHVGAGEADVVVVLASTEEVSLVELVTSVVVVKVDVKLASEVLEVSVELVVVMAELELVLLSEVVRVGLVPVVEPLLVDVGSRLEVVKLSGEVEELEPD